VLVVTLGEAVGFTVPAAVGVAVTGASRGPLATLVAIVLAGSCGTGIAGRCPGRLSVPMASIAGIRRSIRRASLPSPISLTADRRLSLIRRLVRTHGDGNDAEPCSLHQQAP
jgi:hypothetical protein